MPPGMITGEEDPCWQLLVNVRTSFSGSEMYEAMEIVLPDEPYGAEIEGIVDICGGQFGSTFTLNQQLFLKP